MRKAGHNTEVRKWLISGIIVSGGFATVQPGSKLSINAVEGFPLEDFSAEVCVRCRKCNGLDADKKQAVRNQIAEAQKIASGSGSEQDIAEAKIELEVSIPQPPVIVITTY